MVVKNSDQPLGTAFVLALPLAVLLFALWLPFGFSMTGLIEEWDLLGLFAAHGPFFYVHPDGPLAPHGLRPLMPLSFALAHVLDMDSFDGAHWLTLAALFAKGCAMVYLTMRATGSRGWGVVAGVLVILWPADTMQMAFRSLHINVALACALSGCALLLKALDMRRLAVAISLALLAALLFLVGVFIYEAALTLIGVPLAVLIARHGISRGDRPSARSTWVVLFWMLSGGLYIAYAAWVIPTISSYQAQVTGDAQSLVAALREVWPKLFSVGIVRAAAGGWIDSVRMVRTEFQSRIYLGAAAAIVAIGGLGAIRAASSRGTARMRDEAVVSWAVPWRVALVGFVLMVLGYAPFLSSPAHIAISQRTYLWSTPGAVLLCVGLLMVIWRIARAPVVLATLVLLVYGMGAQLYQLHHYVELSQRQRALVRAIVENFESKPGEILLVLDESGQLGHTWMFSNESLFYVLSHVYGRPFGRFEVCSVPNLEWQRGDPLGRKGQCVETGTEWTFNFLPPPAEPGQVQAAPEVSRRIAKSQTVVVEIGADGQPRMRAEAAAHRQNLLEGQETVDRRYRGILAPRSGPWIQSMFRDERVTDSYRWNFGNWWNMDVPPRGVGWREVEWTGDGLKHRSSAWKMSRVADLRFELATGQGHYTLRGEFDQFASDTVKQSIALRLNGHAVPLRWVSGGGFDAEVPDGAVKRGFNRLEFISDLDDRGQGFAARLDWFAISPR